MSATDGLTEVLKSATRGLVDRESLVQLIALSAVAGEHLLVIGPPGTAKSEAARRVCRVLGGRYFEYLLGRFTEPSEIFGAVDLRKLRDGVVETQTAGMLPEADIAFLDEIFLGSTAILNTLIGILNERTFRRGHTSLQCPLRLCIGASNALPEEGALEAFADRFLLRVFLQPLADPQLEELLAVGAATPELSSGAVRMDTLDEVAKAARAVDIAPVRSLLAQCIRSLRGAGVVLSDRRIVKSQRLVAAAAAMDGRTQASTADLWPLVFIVPTAEGQRVAREVLKELLANSQNAALSAAAEEASAGPAARAMRLQRAATELLAQPPAQSDAAPWKLRLEGIAREIDASFGPQQLPAELAAIRARIVEAMGP